MAVSTIWKLVQHFQKINKTNWSLSWGYWLLKLNSPIVHHHQSPSSTTSSLSWLVDKELHLFVDLCPNRISWLVLQMPAFSWSKINDDEEEYGNDHLDNDHNDERICWQIALLIRVQQEFSIPGILDESKHHFFGSTTRNDFLKSRNTRISSRKIAPSLESESEILNPTK